MKYEEIERELSRAIKTETAKLKLFRSFCFFQNVMKT